MKEQKKNLRVQLPSIIGKQETSQDNTDQPTASTIKTQNQHLSQKSRKEYEQKEGLNKSMLKQPNDLVFMNPARELSEDIQIFKKNQDSLQNQSSSNKKEQEFDYKQINYSSPIAKSSHRMTTQNVNDAIQCSLQKPTKNLRTHPKKNSSGQSHQNSNFDQKALIDLQKNICDQQEGTEKEEEKPRASSDNIDFFQIFNKQDDFKKVTIRDRILSDDKTLPIEPFIKTHQMERVNTTLKIPKTLQNPNKIKQKQQKELTPLQKAMLALQAEDELNLACANTKEEIVQVTNDSPKQQEYIPEHNVSEQSISISENVTSLVTPTKSGYANRMMTMRKKLTQQNMNMMDMSLATSTIPDQSDNTPNTLSTVNEITVQQSNDFRLQMIKRSSKKLVDRHSELKLTQFSTKYVLDNKIGEGMHSSVYKCYKISDIEKKQPYAVKVTRDDDEEKKIANRNEYKISKNLLHRNIVRSIELFENEIEGEMHLVMQYVEGIEVLDQIAQQPHGVYTEMQAKYLFKQILEGIAFMHEQNIVHRDIKPQNMIVQKDKTLLIIDFNVSRTFHNDQKLMTKTGTVQFSAPEIFTQKSYNEKIDVWSAGIILYMMLGGCQPFVHQNMPKLIKKIKQTEPNYHTKVFEFVSDEAIDLLKQMLIKNPEERPSARDCLKHPWLHEYLDSDETTRRFQNIKMLKNTSTLNMAVDNLNRRKTMKEQGKLCTSQSLKVSTLLQELIYEGIDSNLLDDIIYQFNLDKKEGISNKLGKVLGITRSKSFKILTPDLINNAPIIFSTPGFDQKSRVIPVNAFANAKFQLEKPQEEPEPEFSNQPKTIQKFASSKNINKHGTFSPLKPPKPQNKDKIQVKSQFGIKMTQCEDDAKSPQVDQNHPVVKLINSKKFNSFVSPNDIDLQKRPSIKKKLEQLDQINHSQFNNSRQNKKFLKEIESDEESSESLEDQDSFSGSEGSDFSDDLKDMIKTKLKKDAKDTEDTKTSQISRKLESLTIRQPERKINSGL